MIRYNSIFRRTQQLTFTNLEDNNMNNEVNPNDYNKDVSFSDAAQPAVDQILRDVFTPYSTINWNRDTDRDIKEGIDIDFIDEATQELIPIQAKILGHDKAKYKTFTVGWKRNGGDRNGELFTAKCRYYISGYAKSENGADGYQSWIVLDFIKFKSWILKKMADDKFYLNERLTAAPSTVWFIWIDYCDIPSDMIVASSEPIKHQEEEFANLPDFADCFEK